MAVSTWVVLYFLLAVNSQVAADSDLDVSVFSTTSRTVILRWTRYPGATSYKIAVALKNSPGSPVAFVTYGANTVMGSITSLSSNVDYIFTVEALSDAQVPLSSGTTESSTAPEQMDPIQVVKPKDSRSLMVEFNPKPTASHYLIRVQNSDGLFREEPVSSSPAEIQALTPYSEYTLSVLAVNSGGRSQPSQPVTVHTVLPPPELSASSPSNDSIVVSWSPVAHAVLYTVSLYKLNSNMELELNTSDTNLTVWGLDAGSQYAIRGYAWDPKGREGERSLYINQTTRPPTPSSINVTMVMINGVRELSVSWEYDPEVHGLTEYHVISDQDRTCNTTSDSCRISAVGCGEVHSIQVTASNEAGPGHPSLPVVFITIPCAPESLSLVEASVETCELSWSSVLHADSYVSFIKTSDGREEMCNTTTNTTCTFSCQCGYTYLMSVLAFNQAGSSPQGQVLNRTTVPCCPEGVTVSSVSTDTLEIVWSASRGAEVYETRAVDSVETIICNDTAPVCALSDLTCDSTYSVLVIPCSDIGGCNRACKAHTKDTAPCMPSDLILKPKNSSSISVSWTATNRAATYTASTEGDGGQFSCSTGGSSCDITNLRCGSTYQVSVLATSGSGESLPSFSASIETEPCCPADLTVHQVTQAMTNVSWTEARGAHSFITSLTSPRGHARCHTKDSHCLMGCITCSTNYTVTMEAFSHTGRISNCTYQGFSSSVCCPSGVKLFRTAGNSLRVYWRSSSSSSSSSSSFTAGLVGSSSNYSCSASPGESSCDISGVQCGDVYQVVVSPLTAGSDKVTFCPQKLYSVTCLGSQVGTVIYRGKRSVD